MQMICSMSISKNIDAFLYTKVACTNYVKISVQLTERKITCTQAWLEFQYKNTCQVSRETGPNVTVNGSKFAGLHNMKKFVRKKASWTYNYIASQSHTKDSHEVIFSLSSKQNSLGTFKHLTYCFPTSQDFPISVA